MMVIWLIGPSGAGKTYIGRRLYKKMKQNNPSTVLIDGDEIREIFRQNGSENDYSIEGRRKNAERIRELCAWLDREDIDVVCCILSIFEESHRWNRRTYGKYFEVCIDAPIEVLFDRNPKDLYRRAMRGEISNVVGVDIPYHPPENPDLTIENGAQLVDGDEVAGMILQAVHEKYSQ